MENSRLFFFFFLNPSLINFVVYEASMINSPTPGYGMVGKAAVCRAAWLVSLVASPGPDH